MMDLELFNSGEIRFDPDNLFDTCLEKIRKSAGILLLITKRDLI